MARKFDPLNVAKMYATMKQEVWRGMLQNAIVKQNTNQLTAWRYGLQAGLADLAKKNANSDKLDLWVIGRVREVEKAMRIVLRHRHPSPLDDPKADKTKIDMVKAHSAKKRRDKEFELFLMKSNF